MYDTATLTHKAVRWKTCAASSVNRAKWAIAMGATPEEEWCTAAASQGDLGLLQWVRLVGAPWNGGAYKDAAMAGHLHVLEFLGSITALLRTKISIWMRRKTWTSHYMHLVDMVISTRLNGYTNVARKQMQSTRQRPPMAGI